MTDYVLIIQDNGLGDYFLSRNYFKYFKKCEKYKHHKIIFLAKPDRIDCIKHFDKKYFDIILKYNPQKVDKLINKLKTKNITDIINIGCMYPKYDKDPESTIKILTSIDAKNKIAHVIKDKYFKNEYYTQIIFTPNIDMFEFERNKLFFAGVNGVNGVNDINGKINHILNKREWFDEEVIPTLKIKPTKKENMIGISPFKRNSYLSWDLDKWIILTNMLIKNTDAKVMLIGSKNDKHYIKSFMSGITDKKRIINKIGKIKSHKLPEIISKLKYLISAETSTVHISSIVGTKTLCLSNGGFYKRFHPTPTDIIKYIYPKGFNIFENNEEMNSCCYYSPFNLSDTTPQEVFERMKEE